MASLLRTKFSGCALITLIMFASASSANAATGRIGFSGAVVEPTCSTADAHLDIASPSGSVDGPVSRHLTCGQTATDPGRSYSRTVVNLNAAAIASDRLLNYFASYAISESTGGAQPKLVVHTYE